MVRFIFACMIVVAASMLAIPFIGAYNGISEQRAEVLGLNEIETAAGAEEDISFEELYASAERKAVAGDQSFDGGFSDQAPAALAEETVAEEDL